MNIEQILIIFLLISILIFGFTCQIYLWKKGKQKGLSGTKISDLKYYILRFFLPFYIYGYNKGRQDYLQAKLEQNEQNSKSNK